MKISVTINQEGRSICLSNITDEDATALADTLAMGITNNVTDPAIMARLIRLQSVVKGWSEPPRPRDGDHRYG